MSGPVNLYDAVAAYLPKTLPLETGQTVTLPPWGIRADAPENQAQRTYPHGLFEILSANPIYRRRNPLGIRESGVQQVDTITFASGTLDYVVAEQDIASVVSLVGKFGGVTRTFTQGTDYVAVAPKTIRFTGTGALPDDGTPMTVTYLHRMFARVFAHQARPVVRCTLKAKTGTYGGRPYPKEAIAQVLGEALDQWLSLNQGRAPAQVLASGTVPLDMQVMAGRVLSSRAGYSDASLGLATWVVEFELRRHMSFETVPTQRIITAPVAPNPTYE